MLYTDTNIYFFKFAKKSHFFNSAKKKQYILRSFLFGHFLHSITVSKINQGSCLGCLGGDDAPVIKQILRYKVANQIKALIEGLQYISRIKSSHKLISTDWNV